MKYEKKQCYVNFSKTNTARIFKMQRGDVVTQPLRIMPYWNSHLLTEKYNSLKH